MEAREIVSGRDRPSPLVDERPWGNFRRYTHNESTTVKLITVLAGQQLSVQRHQHRDELWVILDDGLQVRIEDDEFEASAGDELFISRGSIHTIGGGASGGRFVEIAFGHFDEDDIERLEDRYGRA